MSNYAHGKLYGLFHGAEDTPQYVGSTCGTLHRRFAEHRSKANTGSTSTLYNAMRETGVMHWRISLIEEFPCANSTELRAREQHHIGRLGPELNMNKAYQTPEEQIESHRARDRARTEEQIERNRVRNRLAHRLRRAQYLAAIAALAQATVLDEETDDETEEETETHDSLSPAAAP